MGQVYTRRGASRLLLETLSVSDQCQLLVHSMAGPQGYRYIPCGGGQAQLLNPTFIRCTPRALKTTYTLFRLMPQWPEAKMSVDMWQGAALCKSSCFTARPFGTLGRLSFGSIRKPARKKRHDALVSEVPSLHPD